MRPLAFATILAAIAGFGVTWIAARALGAESYAEFAAFWGLFFALTGSIDGLQQEVARSDGGKLGLLWVSSSIIGLIGGGIAWIVATPWMPILVGEENAAAAGFLLFLGILSYTFQAATLGFLGSSSQWGKYAVLVTLDSLIRLVLAFIAWVAGWKLFAFFIVTVVGALTWIIYFPGWGKIHHPGLSSFLRKTLSAMSGAGANSILIVGFPALAKLALGDAPQLPVMVLGLTVIRAPIMIPLQRFHTAMIVAFSRRRVRLIAIVIAVIILGVLEALVLWGIGPWLIPALFGAEFSPTREELLLLVLASIGTGLLTVTGAYSLAHGRHAAYSLGWLAAALAAFFALKASPFGIPQALLLASLIGMLIHLTPAFLAPILDRISARPGSH